MKFRTLALGTGLAALTLAGCGEQDEATGNGAEAPERTTAQDVAREASEAAATAGEFAKDQINAYRKNARDGLDAIETSIDALAQRVENLSGEAKIKAERELEDLREQRDAFVAELDEASADSAEAWDDVKAGLDLAWADLESATESAMNRFGSEPSDGESPGDD